MRSRDFIITYRGRSVSPLDPEAAMIEIDDVAHALARIGRANGHFPDFYSVGQHCIDCAKEALARGYGARQALVCLLHDASEAYLSDITSPVKKNLRQYVAVEDALLDVIYQKYLPGGIRPREQRAMKEIDNAMLYQEFVQLMQVRLTDDAPRLLHEPCFDFHGFAAVEQEYLALFQQLTEQLVQEAPQTCWQTVGLVGGRQGWQAAILSAEGCQFTAAATLLELCNSYREADGVLTDVPVGLPESKEDEALRPEAVLRRKFSGSGVAAVPCRQAVYATTDKLACEENIRVLGCTISAQQLTMRQQLREVDELLLEQNEWKNVLRQSDARLLGKGRRMVLQQYGDQLPQEGKKALWERALCLAMIGQLECRNGSETLPATPANDSRGIRMQVIVPRSKG